ncbi:hypothetical protein RUND412_007754 [Rhizina undulata]
MFRTITVSGCTILINVGAAPLIEALLPVIEKLANISLASKDLADIGVRLLPVLFNKDKNDLAKKMTNIGVQMLKRAIRRKNKAIEKHKKPKVIKKKEAAVMDIASTLVSGLNAVFNSHKEAMKDVIQNTLNLFLTAIDAEDDDEGEALMDIGLTLLIVALGKDEYAQLAKYLSEKWAEAIDTGEETHHRYMENMMKKWMTRLSGMMKDKDRSGTFSFLNAAVKILLVWMKGQKTEMVKLFTTAWIFELDGAIESDDKELVLDYSNGTKETIYRAISKGESEALDMTEAGFKVLMEASKHGKDQIAIELAKCWVNALDKASRSEDEEIRARVNTVIKHRERSLLVAAEGGDIQARATSKSGLQILETAITLGVDKGLLKTLSKSWANALANARNEMGDNGEKLVASFLDDRMLELNAVIRGDLDEEIREQRIAMISTIGLELLLATIEAVEAGDAGHDKLTKQLSSHWVRAIEIAAGESELYYNRADRMVDDRAKLFVAAINAQNLKDAEGLGKVGEELLMAAIKGKHQRLIKSLSRSWARVLDKGYGDPEADIVKKVLIAKYQIFENCKKEGTGLQKAEEAKLRLETAREVLRAAKEEKIPKVVHVLKEIWHPDLNDM